MGTEPLENLSTGPQLWGIWPVEEERSARWTVEPEEFNKPETKKSNIELENLLNKGQETGNRI